MVTILLFLSISVLVGFKIGDEIELDNYLNARSSAKFLKKSNNIRTKLSKGTTGTVSEIHFFYKTVAGKKVKANSGIKILVTSGPKKGKSYWVYYNTTKPSLKLMSKKGLEVEASNITEAKTAKVIREVPSIRDPDEEESMVLQMAQETISTIDGKKIQDLVTPQYQKICTLANTEPVISNSSKNVEEDLSSKAETEVLAEVATQTTPSQVTYSALQALDDINSEDLKFVGRDKMPGADLNKACVYKNSKIYLIYNNCMANKKESSTSEIEVISKNGGIFRFYAENFDLSTPNSKLKRSQYNGTWDIRYIAGEAPGNLNMTAIKSYLESNSGRDGVCWVGSSGKAQDLSSKAVCYGTKLSDKLNDWGPSAESFWLNPSDDYYSTLVKLRKLVEGTPF